MKHTGYLVIAATLMAIALTAHASTQTTVTRWKYEKMKDVLHNVNRDVFALEGQWITPPRAGSRNGHPRIVVRCVRGKFEDAYIATDTVLHSNINSVIPAETRYDDEKNSEDAQFTQSSDLTAAFFGTISEEFQNELKKSLPDDWKTWKTGKEAFIHFLTKGEDLKTSPVLVRRAIVGMTEALANQIVMRFDMPQDIQEMISACGFAQPDRDDKVVHPDDQHTALAETTTREIPKITPPKVIFKVEPTYRTTGTVAIQAVIRKDGGVDVQKIIRSLGFALDESAVSALRGWRFQPALQDGVPIDFPLTIEIGFSRK